MGERVCTALDATPYFAGNLAQLAAASHWDLAIADLRLADGHTLEWMRLNRGRRIVVLTRIATEFPLFHALKLGLAGYVSENESPEVLVRAVEAANCGGSLVSPAMQALHRRFRQTSLDKYLTPREQQVLTWLAHGLCDREVAAQLDVAPSTVHDHRKSLYRKLDLHSQRALLRFCYERGLGTP